jgi:hypothetical protein
MSTELKIFGIKFAAFLLASPFAGFALLKMTDMIEEAWKSNNRRKKWIALSVLFFLFALLSGRLQ